MKSGYAFRERVIWRRGAERLVVHVLSEHALSRGYQEPEPAEPSTERESGVFGVRVRIAHADGEEQVWASELEAL